MTVNKRTKKSRQRGSWTHGWGAKKKHRGSGNKGGFGMAGTGKRADTKKPSIWKDAHYFGKWGFRQKGPKRKIIPVNLSFFEDNCEKLLGEKKIEHQNGVYIIDLAAVGFNKLLGGGVVTKKFKFKATYASQKAIDKVKEKGGDVEIKQ
jgi:large subunit ribosomal protein L15